VEIPLTVGVVGGVVGAVLFPLVAAIAAMEHYESDYRHCQKRLTFFGSRLTMLKPWDFYLKTPNLIAARWFGCYTNERLDSRVEFIDKVQYKSLNCS